MKAASLFEPVPDRVEMAPASLANWERILPTLTDREAVVLSTLFDYLHESGFANATGGELAKYLNVSVLGIRPRLTGLSQKTEDRPALVDCTEHTRPSRVKGESPSHAYFPLLPRSAFERWRETLKSRTSTR